MEDIFKIYYLVRFKAKCAYTMPPNPQARVLQPIPAIIPALQNICFCSNFYLHYIYRKIANLMNID
jgi:hypothetical protein